MSAGCAATKHSQRNTGTRNRFEPAPRNVRSAVAVSSEATLAIAATGVQKLGNQERATSRSQFHLGSLTKAITATMVATAVEERRLTWQTRPTEVFSEWRGSINEAYANVTLDDLFRHRAGFAPFRDRARGQEFRGFPTVGSNSEIAHWILQQPPSHVPGSSSHYSNAGPAIAAVFMERILGMSWEEAVRQRVFEPLRIEGGFGWPARERSNQPWGHVPSLFGLTPQDPYARTPLPDFFRPSGDIHMSMEEYGKFLQVHLRGLQGRDSLLKAETVNHLHTPIDSYGLGWGVGPHKGLMSSGHIGGDGSFAATAGLWHTRNIGIAVATNAGTDKAVAACTRASEDVLKLLLGET